MTHPFWHMLSRESWQECRSDPNQAGTCRPRAFGMASALAQPPTGKLSSFSSTMRCHEWNLALLNKVASPRSPVGGCWQWLFFQNATHVQLHSGKNPIVLYRQSHWGIIFEGSKLKARTSLLPRFSEKRRSRFELWSLIFETVFENVTPSGIGCTRKWFKWNCILRCTSALSLLHFLATVQLVRSPSRNIKISGGTPRTGTRCSLRNFVFLEKFPISDRHCRTAT